MRYLKSALLILPLLFAAACEDSREIEGKTVACAGLSKQRVPGYQYEASVQNVVVGVVFIESIIPPVIVVLNEYECPVARSLKSLVRLPGVL